MTNDELLRRIESLERELHSFKQIDGFYFDKDVILKFSARYRGAILAGKITSGGTATYLPTGWTAAKTATGKYTITHNLGSTKYVVVASSNQDLATEHDVNSQTSTSFKVEMLLGAAFADCGFDFIVLLY